MSAIDPEAIITDLYHDKLLVMWLEFQSDSVNDEQGGLNIYTVNIHM